MTRQMIDTTHNGLPASLEAIRALPADSIVAGYNTGTPDIVWTPADLAMIPADLTVTMIDQGYPGNSPNYSANERDCENGAWTIEDAVNKDHWNVVRPCLYLGFPNTFQEAYDAGWRGDVRLVQASSSAPSSPPTVPKGINVIAIQWNFSNPNYDGSVVFDPYWPKEAPVTTPTAAVPPGQWNNPDKWTWKDCAVVGSGTDGNFYVFAYDPTTNLWIKQSLPDYERD